MMGLKNGKYDKGDLKVVLCLDGSMGSLSIHFITITYGNPRDGIIMLLLYKC